ncbi:probable F420-dependent oxidoreductase [Natronomonas pharaonis DSM 2160]|uniref:Probable F420-dependent oxidoreductase n=1 Tax=Natronomonas pharaonis (strain ATCC 35678 / DSM 2160 / CIP 103997 / JCM 8858 / NBRC 14720 / NCIMB 2260 / Gabara) TaxID=348780 RepID=A0A1U7EVI1_NATPD|nr:TIGR04024 family LLM class F420-dependent oxidoreductase [Natronomonas pharaonis]CAI49042.1 probable F420-dependent oxidoreductase [Natronomonas pharaonis DSM 2160]
MPRDVFLPVAAQPSVDALVEQAQLGEQLGYDTAWLPETWGRDAVTTLTCIAQGTDDIDIGTSIMPVYSRSPALIGQSAATLQEVSDGRFRLGLGPSGPVVIENWHGVDFGNPLRRTRETVDVVKQVLAGEEVTYDGEYFDLEGFRLRCDPPEPTPPVDAAGMGPKAVELAGRFADGWHALLFTRDGIRDRLEDFDRGSEMGDRDRDDQRVTLSLTCCVLDDAEEAKSLVKQHTAFYIGGMGTFYRDSLARQGHEETAHEIYDHWQDGDQAAAMDALDDDLLEEIAVWGTPDTAPDHFERFADIDGVESASVSFPRGADLDQIESTMRALAPE